MTNKKSKSNTQKFRIATPQSVFELSRRELLANGYSLTGWALASTLLGKKASAQSSFVPKRNLIWINMSGGWDILEVTDPKPASTSGIDMIYGFNEARDVANSTDGVKIGRWMSGLASLGQDLLVVRGLAMGTTSHNAGSVYMDTGILSNAGRVNAASIPSIVASESVATIPIIQLNGGSDPQIDRGLLNPVSVVRAGNLDLYRSMYPAESAIARKIAVLDYLKNSVTDLQATVGTNDRLTNLKAAEEKVRNQFLSNVGAKLALTDGDRSFFRSGAPTGMNTGFLDAVALTLKLINNDICTTINLGIGGFDTHQNQTTRLQPILQSVDFAITRLATGLRNSGKLDSTLIVLYSDFGRTPRVNGSNGRDHWPTGGAIVIGGKIDGGRAVGATTDDTLSAVNLIHPETGLATSDGAVGTQLNPTHLGGMVVALTLGTDYSKYRPYLTALPCMTRTRT